jgi:hypothetical protein
MKDVSIPFDKEIIFVDSPGCGDTMGAEIDIANGLGIMNAVRRAEEVVPIIFISYLSMGDRAEGIKMLALNISGMIKDFEKHAK